MNAQRTAAPVTVMQGTRYRRLHVSLAVALLLGAPSGLAQHPDVRVSFKFILDAAGNRPPTGNLNTDSEVGDQITASNQILGQSISEFRVASIEIVNIANRSQWYGADPRSAATRDGIRSDAIADPAGYGWRTDALNVYITSGSNSGIADFPPNNNIIILGQGSYQSLLAHEVGHIINLFHTHATGAGGDLCADTIIDNENWTRDEIAMNNFGANYDDLNPAQKAQVDLVWKNLMSYHSLDDESVVSHCQLDRSSTQAYADRVRLLNRQPVYVTPSYTGTTSGSFTAPFRTIQQAITAGLLSGRTLVLDHGPHVRPSGPITAPDAPIVTRKGTASVQCAPAPYDLPYSVQDSENPAVRDAVKRALAADRGKDVAGVIVHLTEAEKHAAGREKMALQLELAQRHREINQLAEAQQWYEKLAEGADQPKLREHAEKKAALMERQRAETAK